PVEDMGSHYAVRLQRAVIQEWKVDVPWARAGETTVANGGDIMKEAGLVPSDALEPETAGPGSTGPDQIDAPPAGPVAGPGATVLSAPGGTPVGGLAGDAPVRLVGYQTDAPGRTWFEVQRDDLRGWVPASGISLVARDPLAPTGGGRPIAAPVSGKGVWATYDLLDRASPEAIVETMRANGLTHIYLQVGRSNLGFYGGPGLDRLLPVAHAGGVAVVAWVYPFLRDTTADVNLTVQAARYTTPGGHRPDALAADVEENTSLDEVTAYGQLVRAMLGDDCT